MCMCVRAREREKELDEVIFLPSAETRKVFFLYSSPKKYDNFIKVCTVLSINNRGKKFFFFSKHSRSFFCGTGQRCTMALPLKSLVSCSCVFFCCRNSQQQHAECVAMLEVASHRGVFPGRLSLHASSGGISWFLVGSSNCSETSLGVICR